MACEGTELDSLDTLLGCPSPTEKILVIGAIGGKGAGGYALRTWEQIKNCIIGVVRAPLVGVVGAGGTNDPVAGTSTFQSDDLIGLGQSNGGKIQIVIDDVLFSNFGLNASFTFDNTTGTLDISSGIGVWVETSGLYIDLNQ